MHQKVYCAGRRLPKWVPLDIKQSEADLAALRRAIIRVEPSRMISPTGGGPKFLPFEGTREHLYRNYYNGMMPNSAVCRCCGGVCRDQMELDSHITLCWSKIAKAILSITASGECIVCPEPSDPMRLWQNGRIPFCKKPECIEKWRNANSVKFRLEMQRGKNYAEAWNEEE
jgi:hypothetical protein